MQKTQKLNNKIRSRPPPLIPLHDITTTINNKNKPNASKHFSKPTSSKESRMPQRERKTNDIINDNTIISTDQKISFYIIHKKTPQNSKEIQTMLHITGNKYNNGDIVLYYQFPMPNKIKIVQKRPHKITPNWLKGQREDISKQILHILFKVPYEDMPKKDKTMILTHIFRKLQFEKAQQEILKSKTYKFEPTELKQIENQLEVIKNEMDIDHRLYMQLLGNESYLQNADFLDLLDECVSTQDFKPIINDLWYIYCDILHNNPQPKKFEDAYQTFRENSLPELLKNLSFKQSNFIEKLSKLYNELKLYEYGIAFDLMKSILISNMKKLFIKLLKLICYNMNIPHDQKDINLTDYQHYCFGGCVICTLLRIYYASHVGEELRFIMIYLIRRLICPKEQYNQIPKPLQLENQGGLYIMSPLLLDVNKSILNELWTLLHQKHQNTHQLPNYESLIAKYQTDSHLFDKFKSLYTLTEYEMNKKYVAKLFNLYVEFLCTKVIAQSLKQLDLNQDGMALRDQFKYGHLKHLQNQKKNKQSKN